MDGQVALLGGIERLGRFGGLFLPGAIGAKSSPERPHLGGLYAPFAPRQNEIVAENCL